METDAASSTQLLPQPPHLTKRRVSFAEAPAVRPKLKETPVDSESNHETEVMARRDRDAIKAAAGGWEIERSIYKKKVAGSRTKEKNRSFRFRRNLLEETLRFERSMRGKLEIGGLVMVVRPSKV